MEKEFVLYPEALALKKLGFDEPCFKVGNPNGVIFWRFMDVVGMEGVGIDNLLEVEFDDRWVEIPTYSQAFRWFREKYHIIGEVKFKGGKTTKTAWYDYVIYSEIDWNDENPSEQWKTYEEAELACLQKLIEIIESKNK